MWTTKLETAKEHLDKARRELASIQDLNDAPSEIKDPARRIHSALGIDVSEIDRILTSNSKPVG